MFLEDIRGPNSKFNWRFSRKINAHIYIAIFCQFRCCKLCPTLNEVKYCQTFRGLRLPPGPPTTFGKPQNCLPMPCFPKMWCFSNKWSMQSFFYLWNSPDILMNMLEYCITLEYNWISYSLFGQPGFHFTFYLQIIFFSKKNFLKKNFNFHLNFCLILFLSGVLQNMSPLSSKIEFALDIQK